MKSSLTGIIRAGRSITAAAGFLLVSSGAHAAIQAEDGFDYGTTVDGNSSTNLNGKDGGSGFTSGYFDAANAEVTSGSLADPSGKLQTSGNSILSSVDGGNNGSKLNAGRAFSNSFTDGDTFWASYLFRTENAGQFGNVALLTNAVSGSTNANFNFGYANALADGSGNDRLGIQDTTGGGNHAASSTQLQVDTTYFLAIKAQLSSGNDTIEFFIDPDPGASASTLSADATATGIDAGTIEGISFNANSQQVGAQTTFDEFRIGDSWDDVSPVPEPSAYALVAGVLTLGFVGWRRFARR